MTDFRAEPSASLLIESMRDIGYSLETALADVIDNSITAEATEIHVLLDLGNRPRIGVLDNGTGMTHDELLAAMRLGCRNPIHEREPNDLGRFGLGLKTASFSQCRRLTVLTRKRGHTHAAIWDLAHVAESDDWLIQVPDTLDDIPWIDRLDTSGTLIIWEDLDRLTNNHTAEEATRQLTGRIDDARRHLQLVFHRFLVREGSTSKISMLLNDRALEPLDPFHANHPATICRPVEPIKVGDHEVTIQAFTLPHHQKVTPQQWEHYALQGGYLKNQGFYVYRERRLIIWGTWFRLARQSELTKLARVKIDMPNSLDSAWAIPVMKASASPPAQVRQRLKTVIDTIVSTSKRVYTSKGTQQTTDHPLPVWIRLKQKDRIRYSINRDHPVLLDCETQLQGASLDSLNTVMQLIESTLPLDMLFADMGASPNTFDNQEITETALQHALNATFARLSEAGHSRDEIVEMLKFAEPFKSNWALVTTLISEQNH